MDDTLSDLPTHPSEDPRWPALRDLVRNLCGNPSNRMGAAFHREHVELVEAFARRLAPLFGADLAVVVPAAILHDIDAIEDFSRVADHHLRGARRAAGILADFGFPTAIREAVARCVEAHLVPVDAGAHGPEAACLSHADALAQMANPAFWLHYAGAVRGLDFAAGRDWYRALLEDRWNRMTDSVKPLARPFLERSRDLCRDASALPEPPTPIERRDPMFLILLRYPHGPEAVQPHLEAHVRWLDEQFARGRFLTSGPRTPRTGGVILCTGSDRAEIEALAATDPFLIHGAAEAEVVEFEPTKRSPAFEAALAAHGGAGITRPSRTGR